MMEREGVMWVVKGARAVAGGGGLCVEMVRWVAMVLRVGGAGGSGMGMLCGGGSWGDEDNGGG